MTVRDFEAFRKAYPQQKQYGPDPGCPVLSMSWYDAAKYCRWLSDRENLDEAQMCYPPLDQIKEGMRSPADSTSGERMKTPGNSLSPIPST